MFHNVFVSNLSFLDEFVTLSQQLISEVTDYNTRIDIAQAFINLINIVPNVIISDAHITTHYIHFIQNCLIWSCQKCPRYHIFNNKYKSKSIRIKMYTGSMSMTAKSYKDYVNRVVKKNNELVYKINATILSIEEKTSQLIEDSYKPYIKALAHSYCTNGSKFWKNDMGYVICKKLIKSKRGISIICISQQVANFIYVSLSNLYPSKNIALFTGSECININSKNDLCDSKQNESVLKNIDAFIYTGVLSVGVDINTDECADYTFLVLPSTKFCSSITNTIQSVGRMRRIKNLHVFYDDNLIKANLEEFDANMEHLYEELKQQTVPTEIDAAYVMEYIKKINTCEISLNEIPKVYTDVLIEILKRDYNIISIENLKAAAKRSTTLLTKSDGALDMFEKYYANYNLDESVITKYFDINLDDLFTYIKIDRNDADIYKKIEIILEFVNLFTTPQSCWRVYNSINWKEND